MGFLTVFLLWHINFVGIGIPVESDILFDFLGTIPEFFYFFLFFC